MLAGVDDCTQVLIDATRPAGVDRAQCVVTPSNAYLQIKDNVAKLVIRGCGELSCAPRSERGDLLLRHYVSGSRTDCFVRNV